jgi:hypothetical protein
MPDTIPLSGLVDFKRIDKLFGPPDEEEDDDPATRTKYQVYPQAALVTAGHVVGQGLMYPFQRLLRALNDSLSHGAPDEEEEADDDEWFRSPTVIGMACQVYNSMMHNTRGNSTQHHGVVLGNVTGALVGDWAKNTGAKNATTANSFVRQCDVQLPHEEYVHKVTDRPLSRDLRVENVIGISMYNVHPRNLSGRSGK